MSNFLVIDHLAMFKETPREAEWLPEHHLARFILAAVSRRDLSAFEDAYAGKGSKTYPPAMLLALFIYGYVSRTFTSRKIGGPSGEGCQERSCRGQEEGRGRAESFDD